MRKKTKLETSSNKETLVEKLDEKIDGVLAPPNPQEVRRNELLGLHGILKNEGINSIGDLEVKIARLNEELK